MKIVTARLILAATMFMVVGAQAKPIQAWQQPSVDTQTTTPQQEDGWVTIKLDEGLLFVWNVRGLYFTLTIKGKEVKALNDPDHIFFSVDDKIFQIQVAAISQFAPDAKEKKLDDKALLAAHRDWEAQYIEGILKIKLPVRSFNAKLSNGSDALMWQFDMPEGTNAEAKQQIYLTLVNKDYILLLNSVATATVSDELARKFLLETVATLKVSPSAIDVKALSQSIRAGTKP
jgi:hypothetical protein